MLTEQVQVGGNGARRGVGRDPIGHGGGVCGSEINSSTTIRKVSQVLERRIGILWQTGKERHFRNSKKKVETSLANCKEFLMVVGN